tara:strand:- start:12345 stop:13253 length:909 start_codon:yes stop_codon:yes gene_type:complete
MKKVILLFVSLCSSILSAQSTSFSLQADTNSILIGEQINLQLKGNIPVKEDYQWPILPDTIKGLSIIEVGSIDSLLENNQLTLTQNISISSFDSGIVHIPGLALVTAIDTAFSQGFIIRVDLAKAQEDKELYDIKDPLDAPFDWLPWLYISIAVLATAFLIYWLVKRYRSKKKAPTREIIPSLPAAEWALQELSKLEERKLWQEGLQKEYYSELIDILRHFLEREFSIKAMESTAEELIGKISKLELDPESFAALSKSLRLSSMVKFAKQQALPHENEEAFQAIKNFVLKTQIKQVKEEEHE